MTGPSFGIHPPAFRLPNDTRLGPVRLQIADLSRSLEFYQRVLGFRVRRPSDGLATLTAGDDERTLVELVERPGARRGSRRGRLGLFHFAILLPERAALGRFVSHLAELHVPAGASDHLVSEAIYLSDPDGLGIEVYADRPRSAWRAEGGELTMATMPLDLENVVAAAQGERWNGMPAGTTIGHVHLHVGDLQIAADFYHEALGFDKVVWSYPGALFLSAGGYHHHLGVNTWAGPGAEPPTDEDARLLDWTIVLPTADDVGTAARALEHRGHQIERDPGDVVTRDPWGTAVRISSSAIR